MSDGSQRELYVRLVRVVSQAVRRTVARSRAPADVDDLIGEVWLHLVEQRVVDKVDAERGTVEQLVFVAARNRAISLLRKRRLLPWQIVPADDQFVEIHVAARGADPVMLLLAHRDLRKCLGAFSEDNREVLLLSLLHDLTAAEILAVRGERTGERETEAMQKRIQRLKSDLGELLEDAVSTPEGGPRSGKTRSATRGAP